jgi:uncharacterized membrane protein YfcA
MVEALPVVLIVFLAVFTQSLSGFGVALVAMAFLPTVIGIHTATPLVALVMATIEFFLLIRYRHALNIGAVWRIVVASLVGIPVGLLFLSRLDEKTVMVFLGLIIIGYAFYALLDDFTKIIRLPKLEHPAWPYIFGWIAGMLGGAYNTSGPPVIVYGNCRRWGAAEFKSNLQGFFVVTSLVIAAGHAWNGNLTPEVWRYFLWAIPAMAVGMIAGTSLDRYIKPETFRRIVLVLLIIMGARLVFV